jgi:hypothetical protein
MMDDDRKEKKKKHRSSGGAERREIKLQELIFSLLFGYFVFNILVVVVPSKRKRARAQDTPAIFFLLPFLFGVCRESPMVQNRERGRGSPTIS